jgi:hypothetical protein
MTSDVDNNAICPVVSAAICDVDMLDIALMFPSLVVAADKPMGPFYYFHTAIVRLIVNYAAFAVLSCRFAYFPIAR